jgi:hypothetical protein
VGTRTCQTNGTWGACQSAQVVTLNNWQAGSLRLQANQPAGVSANSACDPLLFEIPSILVPEGGLDGAVTMAEGGGVTLTQGIAAILSGCGDASPPPLVVTPGDASLVITQIATPPVPNSLQFTATLSGCAGDGSVNAIWTVDQPGIATVGDGGVFSLAYPYAGPIHVTAYVGTFSGTGLVNVSVNALDTSGVADGGGLANAFSQTCGLDAGGGG